MNRNTTITIILAVLLLVALVQAFALVDLKGKVSDVVTGTGVVSPSIEATVQPSAYAGIPPSNVGAGCGI